MNILTNRAKIVDKSQKRVGRGYGSGKGGHTTGRGAKGDKVRGKTKITFDGSKIKKSWIKRTPFLRGKHRLESQPKPVIFNLDQIDKWFKTSQTVSPESLSKVVKSNLTAVKILSRGQLSQALTFKGVTLSKLSCDKIVKAGGKIEGR